MSFWGAILLFAVAAVGFMRARATWQDDEPHASYAQVISCVAYLTLLLWGTFPLVVFWSAGHALQFYYFPTPYQQRRHEYYPEDLLPYINFGVACCEVAIWLVFQQIR